MIIWGFFVSLFWAFVIAVILWVLCAYLGKIINSKSRMPKLLHLLCFAVFLPTVLLLFVFFTCNRINRALERFESGIAKVLVADGLFVDQLNRLINQSTSSKNVDELSNYLADIFFNRISSEYPIVGRHVNVNKLTEKIELGKHITTFLQDGNVKVQQLIKTAASWLTKGIKIKIRAFQLNVLIIIMILQAIAFGVVMFRAGKNLKKTDV